MSSCQSGLFSRFFFCLCAVKHSPGGDEGEKKVKSLRVNARPGAPLWPRASQHVCAWPLTVGEAFHHLKNALAKNRKDWTFQFLIVLATQLERFYRITQVFLK